jgi:hypothetical protein
MTPGYIYLITNTILGGYKIGCTSDLSTRMKALKVPSKGTLLASWYVRDMRQIELDWHRHFSDVRIPQSEWFGLSKSQVTEIIDSMNTYCKTGSPKEKQSVITIKQPLEAKPKKILPKPAWTLASQSSLVPNYQPSSTVSQPVTYKKSRNLLPLCLYLGIGIPAIIIGTIINSINNPSTLSSPSGYERQY